MPVCAVFMALAAAAGAETGTPGVHVDFDQQKHLQVTWDAGGGRRAQCVFTTDGGPLIESLSLAEKDGAAPRMLAWKLSPFLSITEGTRESPPGRPPEMSIWNTFFDNPAKRPHQTNVATFKVDAVYTIAAPDTGVSRVTIGFDGLECGTFRGAWSFTFFAGSPLIQTEAVVGTEADKMAFVFDAGLRLHEPAQTRMAWLDTEDRWQGAAAGTEVPDRAVAVKHRAIFAETARGTLTLFPAPHQFFYPVDITTNNRTAWFGRGHQGDASGAVGIGIRQDPRGGGNFVPWCNAPPGTKQRLGFFILLDTGNAENAMRETLRFTHGDRFEALPGHTTFTSHYHMAVAVTAMERAARGKPPVVPEFVKVFKDMGVRIVHLAEFHGDGHREDPGPLRLPEMQAMFDECRRLSDHELLLLPGEEGNDFLGVHELKKHPGHWMCIFPKPVFWTMKRAEGQPLVENIAPFGAVYHIGSRTDMVELLQREHGMAWSAHPRIKASSWTPDIFRHEDFFLADSWLGGAWKHMPADLSRERLGERCLNLLDDMCNWGVRKQLPGEVDVFKIDHTHELYGHMNINYLRMEQPPRYAENWQPVLDALRAGAFFTTTGEVLIRDFIVGGKRSGETLALTGNGAPEVRAELNWTFPLKFAEVISGDGREVFRERVDLTDTTALGTRTLSLKPRLTGRKWVRFEVWDIAANGAYTQPIWLEQP